MSLFITFEGGEGCGKSYQCRLLYRELVQKNIPAIITFEPGGTPLGNYIRSLIKKRKYNITPMTELFLFLACRTQLTSDIILPAIKQHKVVICDRYSDSTMVYQGFARGLNKNLINSLNKVATQEIRPDITILLDVPIEEGLQRKKNKLNDRFDSENIVFHQKVRQGFLKLAEDKRRKWLVLDASLPKKKIAAIIWEKINPLLSAR